jgi:bcr-type benzoyl-CoA reductase subunit C
MDRIQEILAQFEEASEHPYRAIQTYNTQGKKVIGVAPYFVPCELIHAGDMYPVELWGGSIEPSEAYQYYPVFYCSILLSLLEYGLKGDYDFLSGIIIPTTCDGLRNLEENWKYAKPDMPVIALTQPANRKAQVAEEYYVEELHRIAAELEKIGGKHITDAALFESIQAYNKQKALMREFSVVANSHLDIFTPKLRHYVFKAARVMPVEIHSALVEELLKELAERPAHNFAGVSLVATSILLDSTELLDTLEKEGIAIVGDDIAGESKRYETDAPAHVDPFVSLARVWSRIEGCSVLYDPKKLRASMLVDLCRQRQADGVLISIIKFCEEEEFDYPILKKTFEKEGIPVLYLETETQGRIDEQAATRIQAFKEMLE